MAMGSVYPGTARRGRTTGMVRPRTVRSRKAILKRIAAVVLLFALTAVAVVLLYGVWLIRALSANLPSIANLADLRQVAITRVVSSDGVVLATLETQHRRPVPLSQISPNLINATLAIEDSRFYTHHGVDYRGIARALWSNLRDRDPVGQGASTITQQLARNVFLTPEKTLNRKLQEILLARKIEAAYSKPEILEMYLNLVYYGEGNYGAEAASRAYFGKPASKLTLGEAALLAGLPQRPSAYSPVQHRDAALQRRAEVLERMAALGMITPGQKAKAEAQRLHILRPHVETAADWKAPYFVTQVLKQVRQSYGEEMLYAGVTIETTLDWRMQQAAERALRSALHGEWGATTGALVSIDPRTGYVRALVGGADFRRDQFNAATQGVRQPGSAFKPFVYLTAFDNDICDLWTTVKDQKLVYSVPPKTWVVHNYSGGYSGPVSVLDALRFSINTVAVQVAEKTDPGTIASYAYNLVITTPLQAGLPLALGASGVHPLDICSAYSAFANGGYRYDPAFVVRINGPEGQEVFKDNPEARLHPNFIRPLALDQLNAALRHVVLDGTGAAAAFIPDARGKTGTTDSRRDAWFVGYTGDLATAVWVANAHKVKKHAAGGKSLIVTRYLPMPGATGGHLCAPIWRRFMAAALPLQQKYNRKRGIAPGPLPVPTLAQLQKTLQQQQQQGLARTEEEHDEVFGTGTEIEPQPDNYHPKSFAAAPPPDDSEEVDQPADSEGMSSDARGDRGPVAQGNDQEGQEDSYSQPNWGNAYSNRHASRGDGGYLYYYSQDDYLEKTDRFQRDLASSGPATSPR